MGHQQEATKPAREDSLPDGGFYQTVKQRNSATPKSPLFEGIPEDSDWPADRLLVASSTD